MYTVIRVTCDDPSTDLNAWVDAFNASSGLPRLHEMRNNGGYVAEVCREPSWDAHVRALAPWVERLRGSSRARESDGVTAIVDVAVEPEDRRESVLSFDLKLPVGLLADLSEAEISCVFSVYPGDDATD